MRFVYSFIFSLVVLLYSCNPDSDREIYSSSKTEKVFFPMEIGNYWVYTVEEINSSGEVKELDRKDSIVIVNSDFIDDTEVFTVFKYLAINDFNLTKHEIWDSCGFLKERGVGTLLSFDLLGQVIDDFTYFDPSGSEIYSLERRIDNFISTLDTPIGEFDVINVKDIITSPLIPGEERFNNTWYSENIGLAGYSYSYIVIGGEIKSTLSNFNLE